MKIEANNVGVQGGKVSSLVWFFFSSRRRHTRYIGDWSSDVCSSDLYLLKPCAVSSLTRRVTTGFTIIGPGANAHRLARERVGPAVASNTPPQPPWPSSLDRKSVV